MTGCELFDTPDIELHFYGELDPVQRARVDTHLRRCAPCRQRLADLHAIRRALADRPAVDAPPAGDWSGFMRRLDRSTEGLRPSDSPTRSLARRFAGSLRSRDSLPAFARVAAMFALVMVGVYLARTAPPSHLTDPAQTAPTAAPVTASTPAGHGDNAASIERALREVSAEHLERSKLVVLGLATRDPHDTKSADWRYERQLAGTLLSDTRLYRLTAQDRGISDVARVMRDLETVLLETSMSDEADRDALERVQRLIAKRDLVLKMQVVATTGSAGI